MSIRAKYHLMVFFGWYAGGAALMVMGMEVHPALVPAILPYALVMVLLLLRMRCPSCGRRLATQTYLMCPYLARRCRYCGYDLGRRERERGRGD